MSNKNKPKPVQLPRICETCRYWSRIEGDLGQCRRFPPVIVPGMTTNVGPLGIFPITPADSKECGEFQSLDISSTGP